MRPKAQVKLNVPSKNYRKLPKKLCTGYLYSKTVKEE
jgi:hypothetical protein